MQINPQTPCSYDSYETSRPKTLLASAMPIWKIKTAAFSKQQLGSRDKADSNLITDITCKNTGDRTDLIGAV